MPGGTTHSVNTSLLDLIRVITQHWATEQIIPTQSTRPPSARVCVPEMISLNFSNMFRGRLDSVQRQLLCFGAATVHQIQSLQTFLARAFGITFSCLEELMYY